MPDINLLPHINSLENIETDFKIYAGPGAGKTTWLVNHLENVIKCSKRLGKTGKIACITYTNVAADEIITRLNCDKSRFDISTIHSFLYRNIVKPFSYLIAHKDNHEMLFNINDIDGHDEHIVQGDRLRRWIITIGSLNNKDYGNYLWPKNKSNVVAELSSLDYSFNGQNVDLIIRQNRGAKIPKSNGELWLYKEKYWHDGIMHHEDVLYFSYLIISRSPRILDFIRNKFPYIFIDEFQDTTELQTWILNCISELHTKIGLVGDLAQSIYKFTGAKRSDFVNFKSDSILEFKLDSNHRSTKQIINFLNRLRLDIIQSYGDEIDEGEPVCILVGNIQAAKKWFESNIPNEPLFVLTRNNLSVSEINNQLGALNENLLKAMYANDSNSIRAKLIHSILIGYQFYNKDDYKNSINEILRPLKLASKKKVLKLTLRKIAIEIIDNIKLQENRNKTIYDFYIPLRTKVKQEHGFDIAPDLRTGSAKVFYEANTIEKLLPYIKVDTKSNDLVRTIHSAKGTEFKNTLIHFDSSNDFRKYILNCISYIDANEDDARIYYVGCSRARARLFINIPEITQDDINALKIMNLNYEKV